MFMCFYVAQIQLRPLSHITGLGQYVSYEGFA